MRQVHPISEPEQPWGRREQRARQPVDQEMTHHGDSAHDAKLVIREERQHEYGDTQGHRDVPLGSTAVEGEQPRQSGEERAHEPIKYAMNAGRHKSHGFSRFQEDVSGRGLVTPRCAGGRVCVNGGGEARSASHSVKTLDGVRIARKSCATKAKHPVVFARP